MRKYFAIIALLLLSACGDNGSDINSPPAGEFSLTVSGKGTGSGHVITSPAATPGVDCALANGNASGTCSGNYAEGTSVTLTATPDIGSTFTGWSGDAGSCGTTLTCALEMTGNKTGVAEFNPGAATLPITTSTYYLDPEFAGTGAVIWVAEVQNTTSQTVETAKINFTSHDNGGNVLASDFTFVGPIPPGETRAGRSFADYHGNEASVDIQVGEVTFATEDPHLDAAKIISSNWKVEMGVVHWTVEVQNTTADELQLVNVDFVTYDANGKIIIVDNAVVGPIQAGEKASTEGFADLHGGESSAKFQIESVF
jgi:Divergent InlB B-repeat domain